MLAKTSPYINRYSIGRYSRLLAEVLANIGEMEVSAY